MERAKTTVVILVGLMVMSATTAVGLQDVPGRMTTTIGRLETIHVMRSTTFRRMIS